ncbi:MAG: HEAT repeat domain-containing protein [Planctomycetes bacterium]|jgi:hypothetical protein|nr:HEAT repeat domain-containing protein [Planctomycetota bacterium]
MNGTSRSLFFVGLLLLPILVSPAPPASGDPPKCTCRQGNACYHFLNAPVDPPDDPCNCPLCRAAPGGCPKILPEGWDATCANNRKMECFLRRHAASWKLACSEALDGKCDCNNPNPQWCPQCGVNGRPWREDDMAIIRRQVEIERGLLGARKKFVVVKSPHFYLVTDIQDLKLSTQQGAPRIAYMHEIAHLFIQRAEIAWDDFVRYFGSAPGMSRPGAIYLMDDSSTMEQVQAAYFGSPRTNIVYGGGSTRIAGGYPFNGFATSRQKARDDYGLHVAVRHSVAHLMMSCWVQVNGNDKYFPRWFMEAGGHWLSRLHPRLREMATFCADEGTPPSDNGRNWREKLLKIAGSPRSAPVQKIFDVHALSQLELDMQLRAWSWFDVYLEEDRERFVKFLSILRKGTDHRTALREAFGGDPEDFDRRWRDRILGRRPTVAPTPEELDTVKPDAPGAKERALIRAETDPATLAARIKSLQAVNDPLTAATLVPLFRTNSERVRETIVVVLGRTKAKEVREWLRTTGLSENTGICRAYVARVLADIGDQDAAPELMKYLGDGYWLARAHIARALGLLQYEPALPTLREMAKDRAEKVRIAAFDAIACFGEKSGAAWLPVSQQLNASAWQVRSAAADCLGALGQMDAVEPLITRMESESGRVRKDIREALKKITRDDLGMNPKYWRDWWTKERARAGGGIPDRPDAPKEPAKDEPRYAETPTYYGLEVFSEGVGYVIDISSSMASGIRIDPGWLTRFKRSYPPEATKAMLARSEVEASLATLDPRTRFNLYFFRSMASKWENSMVPATPSNVKSAGSRLRAESPTGTGSGSGFETNYVDVFRLVLDIKPGQDLVGNFGDTPDTIFFLTDGEPTTGDITEADVLASWYRELNRFARVKTNVITFGNLGVDTEFLRRLAEENGGVFVQVPEAR